MESLGKVVVYQSAFMNIIHSNIKFIPDDATKIYITEINANVVK